MSPSSRTVKQCLASIGVTDSDLSSCANLLEEFSAIKKTYFKKVLICHPDKGGDAAEFRNVQTSFEVLREMYIGGRIGSFVSSGNQSVGESYDDAWNDFEGMATPSWEYYYNAAEEEVPLYRVELAKSGRGTCKQTGAAKKCTSESIAKGEIRIGWMDEDSGSYGGWVHLMCWRVPSRVWLGLPDPETCTDAHPFETALTSMNEVLLCGFSDLPEEDQQSVVNYVMDKDNWARLVKRKEKSQKSASAAAASTDVSPNDATTQEIVSQGHDERQRFVMPIPGQNGAQSNSLQGKTVVLTGTFPEVGGGRGLNLGKDKVKNLITSFGGRVTGSISGKTDILVVGKEPGFSKVSKARERDHVQLISLRELKQVIEGACLENTQPAVITNFSSGYGGNSLAIGASASALAIARGTLEPTKKIAAKKKRKQPKKKAIKEKAEEPAESFTITCDGCGKDCTERSWFVGETEKDYCDDCHSNSSNKGVLQSRGVTIEKLAVVKKKRKRG